MADQMSDLPPDAYHDAPWIQVLPWLSAYDPEAAPELSVAVPSPDWWLTESPAVTTMAVDHDELCRRLARTFIVRHADLDFDAGFPTLPTRLPVAALRADASARTVFQRLQARAVADLAPLSVQALYDIRGTGQGTVEEIVAALVSAAIVRPAAQGASVHDELAAPNPPLPPAHVQLLEDLGKIAAWRHLRNSAGLPLLKITVEDAAPEPIQEAAQRVSFLTAADITPAIASPDPVLDLVAQLSQLDDVQMTLLRERLLARTPRASSELAGHLQLDNEQVHQLEIRTKSLLSDAFGFGTTIGNLLASLRVEIQPVAALQRLTDLHPELTRDVPGFDVPLWLVLDRLDDYFEVTDGWAAAPDVDAARDRTRTILDDLGTEHGVVHLVALQKATNMPAEELRSWLTYCRYPLANGQVLTRISSIADHAAGLIAAHGVALPLVDLHRQVCPGIHVNTLAEHLAGDERFVNTEASRWGLSSWQYDEEATIRRQIDLALDSGLGQIAIDALVQSISERFDVSPGNVRAYATTGDYQIVGGLVQRQQRATPPPRHPSETRRLYKPTEAWTYRLTVTRDHLRGSGFPVPAGVAGVVGCRPGDVVELDSPLGVQHIRWTGRQPSCGTIKRFLDSLNAQEGQVAFLEFPPNGGFNVRLSAQLPDRAAPLQRALALTGAEPAQDPDAVTAQLAGSLGLPLDAKPRRILSTFQRRGDDDIAELLERAWTRASATADHAQALVNDRPGVSDSKTQSVSPPPTTAQIGLGATRLSASNTPQQIETVNAVEERPAPHPGDQDDNAGGQVGWVPVPEGYRSVGWIRIIEAEAAAEAYRIRTDVPVREHGTITGWARYHDGDTAEARKFHANVLVVRTRSAGERFVCWIREHEAAGIIQADRRGSTVPLSEPGGGWVGRVEYFPPSSEAAKRYRSTTRLLRIRSARQHDPSWTDA
ncbi:hypothetical protein RB614_03195 [Phytohabitans sp. ZYX-F-186]|uniref:RNA polymerase sigma-70 region 4 domain-containing protein n=1 Tax=Phytohabitans maris TaxID=3071409 RepID=A0ABU0Z949_9ACTN|nr:hypothetical protein [Phytohabitans sp. ZYX-F-186]MDQ7903518.1 hypothetical protein [Phytohabitans sp. ZYX-F-186]